MPSEKSSSIARTAMLISLLAVSGVYWLQQHQESGRPPVPSKEPPCQNAVAYRIGQIDPHFQITRGHFEDAIKAAAAVWQNDRERTLFIKDDAAPFSINLVFDERQSQYDIRRETNWRIDANQNQVGELKKRYEERQAEYQARLSNYQRDVDAFNLSHGNIDEFNRLQQESFHLKAMGDEINSIAMAINALSAATRDQAVRFNEDAEKIFAAAECYRGQKINIYQFADNDDLILKLAHELGHALTLGHVKDPKSVMYYLVHDQDAAHVALSNDDKAALKALCGGR